MDGDAAEAAAAKFEISNVYDTAEEMLAREKLDAVSVITPNKFHCPLVLKALKAGKHVFAEKGVAVDAPGVRLMIEASRLAADKALTVVCGTQRRHQRGYLQVKKALDDGIISPILGGEVYWTSCNS